MKYSLLAALLLLGTAVVAEARPLCAYTARISDADKHNSRGEYLGANGISISTVAAIIRQDRANFHEYGIRDPQDENDCAFASKTNRNTMEAMLQKGSASMSAMQTIVEGNPLIRVEVNRDFVDVKILDAKPAPRSTVH